MGLWTDGEPISQATGDHNMLDYSSSFINSTGDNTVTVKSALFDNNIDNYEVIGDHREIIKGADGINKIFSLLDIDYPYEAVSTLIVNKILAIIMHSPANVFITDSNGLKAGYEINDNYIPDSFYDPESKTIILINPSENLSLTVIGENTANFNSDYSISFYQINEQNKEQYYLLEDVINPGESKKILLDTSLTTILPPNENRTIIMKAFLKKMERAISLLNNQESNKIDKKNHIKKVITNIQKNIKSYDDRYSNSRYIQALTELYAVYRDLFHARQLTNTSSEKGSLEALSYQLNNLLLSAFDDLNLLFTDSQEKVRIRLPHRYFEAMLKTNQKMLTRENNKMQLKFNADKKIFQYQVNAYALAEKNYLRAQNAVYEKKYPESLLYLLLSMRFLGEI